MATDEGYRPPPPAKNLSLQRRMRWVIIAVIVAIIVIIASRNILIFFLNIWEFGDLFIRPFIFQLTGGLVLAVIILFRIDFRNRRSIVWWAIRLSLRLIRQSGSLEAVPPNYIDFKTFKMSPANFAAWQVTKVIVGMLIFQNILFGMTVTAIMKGWNPDINTIWGIFSLPFITPPFDLSYASTRVIPMVPALTLIISPVLGALGVRLALLVGVTQILRVATPSIRELSGERAQFRWRITIIEGLIALGLFWAVINSFFPNNIDYNTRYAIAGLAGAAIVMAAFAYLDAYKGKGLSVFVQRRIVTRVVAVIIIALVIGSVMAVNNSIADARKVEWLGPYVTQQIGVNRYMADIDSIKEITHIPAISPVSAGQINSFINNNTDILERVRLWDWDAGFAKLKPEIGLIPYVQFEDSDILRFNHTLYWAASMKPTVPSSVLPQDLWYAQHFVYTHVPDGFLMLNAQNGTIVDPSSFFQQRQIYYGEGGLFSDTWASYPADRTSSTEVLNDFYRGKGGIDVIPPLSWIFEFNFFWAYPTTTMHLLRYRDDFNRMDLLLPYFKYMWNETVGILPVTDGAKTYYMIPLVISLNTDNVPWSTGNPYRRLIGYALIDIYNGNIQMIILGNDFYSQLFRTIYSDYIMDEIPSWLDRQLRYPQELFEWRAQMYNFYHVKDPATFIIANQFYEVPSGLSTYYIEAEPPGISKPEYIGILSLELRGAAGRNLAGFMIVRNEIENFGEMVFYQVPLASEAKLLGPSAVIEALEKDPDFATLRTLLRQPRVGDNILYRIGNQDVYFIPVYTAGAGGVVTEMGTVAAVGADFTGQYYVGLGPDATSAFRSYLNKLSGLVTPPPGPPPTETLDQLIADANAHLQAYLKLWSQGKYAEAGSELDQFQAIWQEILARTQAK